MYDLCDGQLAKDAVRDSSFASGQIRQQLFLECDVDLLLGLSFPVLRGGGLASGQIRQQLPFEHDVDLLLDQGFQVLGGVGLASGVVGLVSGED